MASTTAGSVAFTRSQLLDLPLELRLQIYYLAIADSEAITIATEFLDPADQSTQVITPDLPSNQIASVKWQYDPSLLLANPALPNNVPSQKPSFHDSGFFDATEQELEAEVEVEFEPRTQQEDVSNTDTQIEEEYGTETANKNSSETETIAQLDTNRIADQESTAESESTLVEPSLPQPPLISLLRTCRQIRNELESPVFRFYYAGQKDGPSRNTSPRSSPPPTAPPLGMSIFVTYPYGLIVLREHYANLLKYARSINISGYIEDMDEDAQSHSSYASYPARMLTSRSGSPEAPHEGDTDAEIELEETAIAKEEAAYTFKTLVRNCFSVDPHPVFASLQMRLYCEGSTAYINLWKDEDHPVCLVQSNTRTAIVDLDLSRGKFGCAIVIKALPSPDQKIIANHYKLNNRERREDREKMLVDPRWPEWKTDASLGVNGDTSLARVENVNVS